MNYNRKRYACARKIQTINTIPKRRNVIFTHVCTIYQAVDYGTLCSGQRRNCFILGNRTQSPTNNNLDCSVRTTMMVLLISACTWTYRKTGSCRNWENLVLRTMCDSNRM